MKQGSALSKWISTFGIISLVLTLTIIPAPVIMAQKLTPDAQVQETVKKSPDEDLPPLPSSPIEIAEKDGTALRLSLKDITKLALQNNLDIAISDTNEQLYQQKIIATFGNYDPTLTAQLGVSSQISANTNLATAATQGNPKNDRANWNFGFSQNVRTGGQLQASWNSSRSDTNTSFSLFSPQYNSAMTVQFTQPLWRNLRIDSNRGSIKLANLDLESNDSKFRQKVTETIENIQQQYWNLVSAIRDYDIKRSSVNLGQITLRDNKKKVDVGTLAPISITEAQADLKSRELNLISSEEQILRQENTVRQLVTNDKSAEIWTKVIVPTDEPDFIEYKIDLGTAIETALKKRPELEQYDIQLRQADINLKMTENSRKWQFDVNGQFGTTGVAGPQTYSQITGMPTIKPELVGGIGTAYKTNFTQGFTNWQVSFNVSVPLRTRNLSSQYAQQKIQKQQTVMNRKAQEQSIQVEIRNAVQKLKTNRQQVETAKMQTQLNKEQLDGEVKRFEAGLSESYRVLDRQNSLAQAQNAELVNLINYKLSVIALQKAMNILLESNDFELAKGSSGNVPDLK
ncbi:MAG TPA: TolC family protein [Acidobacteriota bacterium]|nr:TolC family protein [Acidobacteriota bacterium]